MENPNLNETVIVKMGKVREALSELKAGLGDRWTGPDSYMYQKIEAAIDNVVGMFLFDEKDFSTALEEYEAAREVYLAGVVETKEVKNPKTGEMVKLRIRKPQVRMALTANKVEEYNPDTGMFEMVTMPTHPTNENLLAEHLANLHIGTINVGGKLISSPFISDGIGPGIVQIVEK